MRIDQLLHWLCLQKSRSMTARGCRQGWILLNDKRTRPSKEVHSGDRITIFSPLRMRGRVVRILEVPSGQVRRKDAGAYYEIVATRKTDGEPNGQWEAHQGG